MKKTLSLILALAMILSCVFVLASCKDGDDEGESYTFKDTDFKVIVDGEDMTESLESSLGSTIDAMNNVYKNATLTFENGEIVLETKSGSSTSKATYPYTKKNDKYVLDQEAMDETFSSAFGLMGLDADSDNKVYVTTSGSKAQFVFDITMNYSGIDMEIIYYLNFKK